ncbi:MAG: carboxypeptidase-like regulatory domain-containing protein, partial [Salegentibacter sp.]
MKQKTKSFLLLLFLMVVQVGFAQQRTISGVVKDESGMPMPGVNVSVKGTAKGTQTNFDGEFTLADLQDGETVVYSFLGYKTEERIVGQAENFDVLLQPVAENLNEVVVTALGIKREEKALGYAVQKIEGESLQKVQGVDVTSSLTGKVAGLLVKNSTDFNVTPDITIRGESPLLVIDGIAYSNKNLSDISSEDIESLSVLKGATAS